MKKIWKVLGVAAAVAACAPVVFRNDSETGEKTVDALLWQYKSRPEWDGSTHRELTIFPCRLPHKKKAEEAELFDEEHLIADEGVLIASYPDPAPELEISDEPGPF